MHRGAQLKGLLPIVLSGLKSIALKALELLQHLGGKGLESWHLRQGPPDKGGHRQAQNPRRPRVGRDHMALWVEHQNPSRQVVQNRLQIRPRQAHLAHAALDRAPRFKELLGHLCKSDGEPFQIVLAREHGSGVQIARGHFSHPRDQP